ncbi:MAG: hypothetical protein ABMA01_14745, partial [Chthoniobacteraceae bacterium]
ARPVPGSEGAAWKADWVDSTAEVVDQNGNPRRYGSWSGNYHILTEDIPEVETGVWVRNDRFKAWGEYHFSDLPYGYLGGGVQTTSTEFDNSVRDAWLEIETASLDEATRNLYPPTSGPLIASTSAAGKTANRLVFWLKTDNDKPAAHDITRLYIKTTTIDVPLGIPADPPVIRKFTVSKDKKTSEIESLAAAQGQTVSLTLLPFELNSDLTNDGKIDGADSSLKIASLKSDATDEAKEKGTEYLFVDDKLSNGLWDKDDDDPTRPPAETDDDDVQVLATTCTATSGAIWFEHPIINKLVFYRTKECKQTADDKMTFPFVLSDTNKLPEKLYVRAEEVTAQIEGELVMYFGTADKTTTWMEDRLKLTTVKELGDTKYFHAVRDYILENNTELFVQKKGYPSDNPITRFRICAMREEATKMEAVEDFYRGATPGVAARGLRNVALARPDFTVLVNGNQVFFGDGWTPTLGIPNVNHSMSNYCHGRLAFNRVFSPATSDITDLNAVPPGSPLAGDQANYIAQSANGSFTFALRQVPFDPVPWMALGGLSTNYDDTKRENLPQTIVGYAPMLEDGNGVVFTASQPPSGGGSIGSSDGLPTGGHARALAEDAHRSGVPTMPDAAVADRRYKLLILDSGRTSVALAHIDPAGILSNLPRTLSVIFAGAKHELGVPYYVNTYLGFTSIPPRPNP